MFCLQTEIEPPFGTAADVTEQPLAPRLVLSYVMHPLSQATRLLGRFVEWFKGEEFTFNLPSSVFEFRDKSKGYKHDSSCDVLQCVTPLFHPTLATSPSLTDTHTHTLSQSIAGTAARARVCVLFHHCLMFCYLHEAWLKAQHFY